MLSNTYPRMIDCKWIIEKEKFNFKNITNIVKFFFFNNSFAINYSSVSIWIIDCKWIIEKEKFNFKNITNIAFKYLR